MLTVRTSAHIRTNRGSGTFRLCPTSTGVPQARAGASSLLGERVRLWNAEARRLWLDERWSEHVRAAQSRQPRRRR
jgi:hypothetical protein